MGMASRTSALMADLWTFLGRIILSPALQVERIIVCTDEVVPQSWERHAPSSIRCQFLSIPNNRNGWPRLSKGFIELTSMPTISFLLIVRQVLDFLVHARPGTSKGKQSFQVVWPRPHKLGLGFDLILQDILLGSVFLALQEDKGD